MVSIYTHGLFLINIPFHEAAESQDKLLSILPIAILLFLFLIFYSAYHLPKMLSNRHDY
jgi:hypothetical protein